jgi:hypothetical protein
MCRITYFTKRNQMKIQKSTKVDLVNFHLKYDVIKVICNKNLERPRNFDDIDKLGDIGPTIYGMRPLHV